MTRVRHFAIHPLSRTGGMNTHSHHHAPLVHASTGRLLIAHGSRAHNSVMPIIVRVRRIDREDSTIAHRAILRGDTTSNTATHLATHKEGSMGTHLEAPRTTITAIHRAETTTIQTRITTLGETATTGVFKIGSKGTGSIQVHATHEEINVIAIVATVIIVITAIITSIPLHASHDKIGTPIQAVEIPMAMRTLASIDAMTTVNTMNAPGRMVTMSDVATHNVHIKDATRNETNAP